MQPPSSSDATKRVSSALCLTALGVVYGDIGTSPLYTLRECLRGVPLSQRADSVLGVLSLIFWCLILVVTVKYLWTVMRADNRGEGGMFALLALAHGRKSRNRWTRIPVSVLIILIGASLLFGEGVITPAISVLGAAEGLKTIDPAFNNYVLPIAVVILGVLFLFQSRGTDQVGRIFGPVMLVWFITLGVLGVLQILKYPGVLQAIHPKYALAALSQPSPVVIALIANVVLAFTGAEALYADMGHFGRKVIARAWYFVVFPGLILNYFGQGAWMITNPADTTNPFFALAPDGIFRMALTALSIAAAVIASQALISGAYSLTRQAIQLGYFPRLTIRHTNPELEGQIFLPLVNVALAISTIWVALEFKSSEELAAAYGISVTGTMLVTTFAFFLVTRRWQWRLWQSILVCTPFFLIDIIFFGASLHKITQGGWLPLMIGAGILAIMYTWKTGKSEIIRRVYANEITEDELRGIASSERIARVRGAAVFMAGNPHGTPLVLLHHVKASKSLQETVLLLSILTDDVPTVRAEERLQVTEIGNGIWRAIARYGYMESPDVTQLLVQIRDHGVILKLNETTYYFNREMIVTGGTARMPEWQKHLYAFLSRNARPAKDYYKIPPNQIIEIGLPIQL